MSTARVGVRRRYTRTDPRGRFPRLTDAPELEFNRLAVFWRPIIDLVHTPLAPMRLRMIRPVVQWLADPTEAPQGLLWFSRIGVPGLRRQVLRHAGLDAYDCVRPAQLPVPLRTPAWQRLVELVARFDELDDRVRALLVFHLAQLSLCRTP